MLQILGRNNSSNVQKVLWACTELGIEYERHDYGGPFNNTTDDTYLALNPNARVPTILDTDVDAAPYTADNPLVMWESNAIVRYLCHKRIQSGGDGALYPGTPHLRAPVEQWLDWQQTTMGPAITPVFWGLIRTPQSERNLGAIEQGWKDTQASLHILDALLGKQDYIAGDAFTIADIPLGIMTYRWFEMPIERDRVANVERWYARLVERPAFVQTVMIGLT